jgi:hypothetical protein
MGDILHQVVQPGVLAAAERAMPLLPAFGELFPGAQLQRGSVVACEGSAAYTLALLLAAGPVAIGAWVGIAGLPHLGLAAAVEAGVALERLVAVPSPPKGSVADVVGAMVDGFEVVLVGSAVRLSAAAARSVRARAVSRGVLVIMVGDAGVGAEFGVDMVLQATSKWHGIGHGHGVARQRHLEVELSGRRTVLQCTEQGVVPVAQHMPTARRVAVA